MSFGFSDSSINQFKAGAAYKDGSGMGGGGMYMRQEKKRKDQPEEDMFEFSKDESDSVFSVDEVKEEDIPQDNFFNKFVNWFRLKHE